MSLVTLALIVFIVAPAAALAYVVVKALRLFRDTRDLFRALGGAADELGRSVDRLSAFDAPDSARMSRSAARLAASRARLSVLLGAVGRVQEQWSSLLAVYPRK